MKSLFLAASLFLFVSLFSNVWATEPNDDMPTAHMTSQTSDTKNQTDGTIIKWIIVLDKNEIMLANEALKRPLSPSVRNYAKYLMREHHQNLQQTFRVSERTHIQPLNSDEATSLKDKGQKGLAKLKTLKSKDFQKTYIDEMVKGHTNALETIKSDLNEANNTQVKKLLKMTEQHVQRHLNKAKAIQKRLS